jgi:hypothetical protein
MVGNYHEMQRQTTSSARNELELRRDDRGAADRRGLNLARLRPLGGVRLGLVLESKRTCRRHT